MKMRYATICAVLVVNLATLSVAWGADAGRPTVATVNLDLVYSQVGYDSLPFSSVDPETKATLAKISADRAKLQQELLKANDELALRKINESLQFLRSKQEAIRNSMTRVRNGGGDYRQSLSRFIKDHFGKKYPIIIQAGGGYDWKRTAIQFEAQEEDITDQVIEVFMKELNNG